jgi:hypothetical protein
MWSPRDPLKSNAWARRLSLVFSVPQDLYEPDSLRGTQQFLLDAVADLPTVKRRRPRKPFVRELLVHRLVALDARFTIGRAETRTFRAVGIPIEKNMAAKGPGLGSLATNSRGRKPVPLRSSLRV